MSEEVGTTGDSSTVAAKARIQRKNGMGSSKRYRPFLPDQRLERWRVIDGWRWRQWREGRQVLHRRHAAATAPPLPLGRTRPRPLPWWGRVRHGLRGGRVVVTVTTAPVSVSPVPVSPLPPAIPLPVTAAPSVPPITVVHRVRRGRRRRHGRQRRRPASVVIALLEPVDERVNVTNGRRAEQRPLSPRPQQLQHALPVTHRALPTIESTESRRTDPIDR